MESWSHLLILIRSFISNLGRNICCVRASESRGRTTQTLSWFSPTSHLPCPHWIPLCLHCLCQTGLCCSVLVHECSGRCLLEKLQNGELSVLERTLCVKALNRIKRILLLVQKSCGEFCCQYKLNCYCNLTAKVQKFFFNAIGSYQKLQVLYHFLLEWRTADLDLHGALRDRGCFSLGQLTLPLCSCHLDIP